MKRKSPFLDIIVRRFARPSRIVLNSAPRFLIRRAKLPPQPRSPLHSSSGVLSRISFVLALILLFDSPGTSAAVREIGAIGLTVNDLNRELPFYTNTLPFRLVSISEMSGPDQDALFGLPNTKLHVATLQLGDEHITLTEHIGEPGKPIPPDSRSFDHWFQHIAIVVSDMDKAYSRLREFKVKHVSTAPQTLPEWNTNAAGIKAFYFRDPEDHVLEIIWFPPGKGDPKWHARNASTLNSQPSTLFLGIDHTAIVVSDTDRSLALYRDSLGLRVVGESENYGVEQEHLNQVFGARLRITSLRAPQGPGIEFLEYITPPGGRPLAANASPLDLVFWSTRMIVDDLSQLHESFITSGGRIISGATSHTAQIVRDPDGHALHLEEPTQRAIGFNASR